jgi:predicted N-acetyltransferase YhbS
MMHWFRDHVTTNGGCWSLAPSQPADLGVRLLARGFQPGWKPCWMALDLTTLQTNYATPPGLQIVADNTTPIDATPGLPYAGETSAIPEGVRTRFPGKAQRFIARLNGKVVAHSCVYFNTGPLGVAGIYNVGVVPQARNQGIGKAVVAAACVYAREKGYRYATLNGTGQRMYQQLGFRFISYGNTWWLVNDRYITHAPSTALVQLTEAVGTGHIATLNELAPQFTAGELNTPLANKMTLMQVAVHYKQQASADWLITHGGTYTVLDAWDLGWHDRAAALLAADPALVNHRYGHWQTTLLHIAAERNDLALAELALQARPDLSVKDAVYHNTALGWAEVLERKELAEMIRQA